MTYAVTQFQAMCGFRNPVEITQFLSTVPEFRSIVTEQIASNFEIVVHANDKQQIQQALKQLFAVVMKTEQSIINIQVEKLITRLKNVHINNENDTNSLHLHVPSLVLRLSEEYPNDIGIFAPYLLNCFTLQPGESIFLPANEPHAYLHGDCVECMAQSDNVVRAGLTPKHRDVDVLINMLTYQTGMPTISTGNKREQFIDFIPPVSEFLLTKIENEQKQLKLDTLTVHSLMLVYSGEGTLISNDSDFDIKSGSVICIPANVETQISGNLVLFRCSGNYTQK
jgi:mannose-6-phosphate isomerase